MNQYKYSQQSPSETKQQIVANNDNAVKNYKKKLQQIIAVKDLKIKNKLLKGFISQLKEQNQLLEKTREKLNQQKIIVIHKKSLSQSTNFSFDNMKSISQVNSVIQEKKKQEILENMIENYQKQIQDKEYTLIAIKKERYHTLDEIEDAIEDLQQTKIIEKYMQNELLAKENQIKFYFDQISNLKKTQKPTNKTLYKSQQVSINKSNQSVQQENHGYTLNIFKGIFGSSIRNQSVFDEHFDKLSTRTVVQRNTTSSGEQ